MAKNKNLPGSFREKLARLESISDKLESEEMDIEEMIRLYEEGMKLSGECLRLLKEAELKINEIKLNYTKS